MRKILQFIRWIAAAFFILLGIGFVVYIAEGTIVGILVVLAGVWLLPPVTKLIPEFKFRNAVIAAIFLVLLLLIYWGFRTA